MGQGMGLSPDDSHRLPPACVTVVNPYCHGITFFQAIVPTPLPVPSSHAGQEFTEPHPLLDALLWRAGPLAFSLSDLIRVATRLGWLNDEIRWLSRCDTLRESAGPDTEVIQGASDRFRYEHDLLTAEETERWLEARSLTADDFQLHCERLAAAETVMESEQPEPVENATAMSAALELDAEAWRVHLWLSGQLRRKARRSAWLLIAARESGEKLPDVFPDLATWQRWEVLLTQQRSSLLSGPKATRWLEVRRWPLTRLSVEVTEFPDAGMAREAELCLTEGSATMEEIVQGVGAASDLLDSLVDELSPELQEAVVTIAVGSLRRVEKPDQPPHLIRVLSRTEPSLEDPSVRARIAVWLQEDLYGTIERELVSWEHPLLRLT